MDLLHAPSAFPTALLAVYLLAGVFSGLSGFGFSAIGCLSLLALPANLAIALLMGLSLVTQAASLSSLWAELRDHAVQRRWNEGVGPYLAGGTAGMPVGLWILAKIGGDLLTILLGALLIAYSGWVLLKPASMILKSHGSSATRSFLVGAAGGVVGGFSAFPGSAIVVWSGLTGATKQQGRALTQPFILWMQVVGLVLMLGNRPQIFGPAFWSVFVSAAPAALAGNLLGVAIYRKTGDVGYRRITLCALGLSGLGLLAKAVLLR